MIDYAILDEYGTTDDRLREFFTAQIPTEKQMAKLEAMGAEGKKKLRAIKRDVAMRDRFQKMIQGWLQEHIVFSLSNHSKYAAVDMAWDSLPINTVILPLIQYAQGRLDLGRLNKMDKDGNLTNVNKNARRDSTSGQITHVDLPKFTEVQINLIRSVITRRLAPQAAKYASLFPHFKYEARDQTQVGKIRADMVSQRMDIMADQYDYRHFEVQCMRDMLLYARCVAFPRSYWEREIQLERADGPLTYDENKKIKKKTRVVKEGIAWVNPHPSRIFYDNAYPLSSLNQDIGCEFVGFWDVCRWGDIADNPMYFNKKSVAYTSGMVDWFSTYWAYFNQYFTAIIPPSFPQAGGNNITATNDRKNQIGLFTGQMENTSTIFTHLWLKIRPQNWGLGTYPHMVWLHLKVAGDATVVYAKICPSSPAAVFSYNENDSRLMNISMAHELMPFQDQLTNLYSQFLEIAKQDLFSVAVLNTDVFPDTPEGNSVRKEFENLMRNKSAYASTQMLEVSFSRLQQLGIKPDQAFTVVRSHPNTALTAVLEAIDKTIQMANEILVISQHEQGQTPTHEISAHESVTLSATTDNVYNFISDAIDEGRAAMKRICFESLISCGSDEVELTVANRYPDDIIAAAGFTPGKGDKSIQNGRPLTGYRMVTGSKSDLNHDYIFTSSDGSNRPAQQQGAQTLVQLLQAIGSLQPDIQNAILASMGKQKVFEIFNSIFRMTDAGVDLNLELKPGESDELVLSQDQQVMQAIQRMGQQLQGEAQATTAMHNALMSIAQFMMQTNPQLGQQIMAALQTAQPAQPQPTGQ